VLQKALKFKELHSPREKILKQPETRSYRDENQANN